MAPPENQAPTEDPKYKIKDLNTENPRWCAGCGDFSIIMAVKRFMVNLQMPPHMTVNISGIGCSGRAPFYIDSYGIHAIHGRAIPVATGISITRPELNLFIHSGDGDAVSIGGNHLIHGINRNFNCVFLLYDNELYALTKSQTSPTTRLGHKTNTQPRGTFMEPLRPINLAIGLGASFVARTADWMPDHLVKTIDAAYRHQGFSFVHVSQRCPHFDPLNFDHKTTTWFSFLTHENGIEPDKRIADKTELIEHDPARLDLAFEKAHSDRVYFGLIYRNPDKPRYDLILRDQLANAKHEDRGALLDPYRI